MYRKKVIKQNLQERFDVKYIKQWENVINPFPKRSMINGEASRIDESLTNIKIWTLPISNSILYIMHLIDIEYPYHLRDIPFDSNELYQYLDLLKFDVKLFQRKWSFAIPTIKSLQWITGTLIEKTGLDNPTILELGAGKGLWSYLLQEMGLNIIATDDNSWDLSTGKTFGKTFTNVEIITGVKALKRWKTDVLFMCWPIPDGKLNAKYLKLFKGNWLLYIGEGYGDATGGDEFFVILMEKWKLIDIYHCQRIIFNDDIYLFERK